MQTRRLIVPILVLLVGCAHIAQYRTDYATEHVMLKGGGGHGTRGMPGAPQIARSAQLSLDVDNVDTAIASIAGLARRSRGNVFDLQASDERSVNAQASLEIRVPDAQFDDVMSAVNALGTLRSRSLQAEDLTSSVADSDARLRNLRRTESDILAIMARSGRVSEVMDAENQLSQIRQQIEMLEADLNTMHRRITYATINVALTAQSANESAQPPVAQLATAAQHAWRAFVASLLSLAAGAIWLTVFMPYVLAAGGLSMLLRLRLRKEAVRR